MQMTFPTDECDDCTPSYLQRRSLDSVAPSTLALSILPLALTWLVVATLASQRLFPILAGDEDAAKRGLPKFSKEAFKPSAYNLKGLKRPSRQRLAALVFSTSLALSAVLVELLLCEISNTLNPAARSLALRITLSSLLVLILLVTPALEIHGFLAFSGESNDSASTRRSRPRLRHIFEVALYVAWLFVFWYIPLIPSTLHSDTGYVADEHAFLEACLERIGIIGISLMASLAGFAAISSLWQTFGVKVKHIKDSDIARKEAGLDATTEMLGAKQSRLRALQRKMSEVSGDTGFMGRMMGSIRGNADVSEHSALQMEIHGLETMRFQLTSSLNTLRERYAEQQRARTKLGRLLRVFNTGFAVYCAYRICATSFSSIRRWWQPSTTFATSDPINNILALLTTHYDPTLDRAAWSRQFSFLLSGIMLLASFNAVLQTFRLFSRFAPGLVQYAQTSLPLVISQIAGTYVISSALLLRSNLPAEVSNVITEALGAPLEGRFVEGWFESWFLVAVGLTATGILVGRKVGGGDDDWDDDGGVEMGKRS